MQPPGVVLTRPQALVMGKAPREAVQRHEDGATRIHIEGQTWQRLQVGSQLPAVAAAAAAAASPHSSYRQALISFLPLCRCQPQRCCRCTRTRYLR